MSSQAFMTDLILNDNPVTVDRCREVYPTKELLPPEELKALFAAAYERNTTADALMRGIVTYRR